MLLLFVLRGGEECSPTSRAKIRTPEAFGESTGHVSHLCPPHPQMRSCLDQTQGPHLQLNPRPLALKLDFLRLGERLLPSPLMPQTTAVENPGGPGGILAWLTGCVLCEVEADSTHLPDRIAVRTN